MNINQLIFSKTQPKKKLEVIEKLSNDELLAVSESTVKKIIQEVGRRRYKSRDKELRIDYDRRVGNNWNSTVESVDLVKGKLYVNLYCQFSSTDATICDDYDEFFARGNYRGEITRSDYYGNPRTWYFVYDTDAKARVMKSILLEYVYSKYADKLKAEAA